jgi:hypothetical protein
MAAKRKASAMLHKVNFIERKISRFILLSQNCEDEKCCECGNKNK